MSGTVIQPEEVLRVSGKRFALCAARWNASVVEPLLAGAQRALRARGAAEGDIEIHRCAGAWELPALAARLVNSGQIDGVVSLGCLVRGDTDHYQLIAESVARALMELSLEGARGMRPVAVAFGVLATESLAQALARTLDAPQGLGNKGEEAALACIEQARALAAIPSE